MNGPPALWVVLGPKSELIGVGSKFGPCLMLFSSPDNAEAWILGASGFEQHTVSPPRLPYELSELLRSAKNEGFHLVTIDPPFENHAPFQCAYIEQFTEQVEAMV